MEVATVESKFDKFANDFYRFLSVRYETKPNLKIKVVEGAWEEIPPKLLPPTKTSTPVISFDWTNADGAEEQKQVLERLGFTKEHAEDYSKYDAIIFLDSSKPVKMKNGTPHLWNVVIAHHLIHLIEILSKQQIINEPPHVHNYENHEALLHLHRFVNWGHRRNNQKICSLP